VDALQESAMRRVMIVGGPGSGKSTLARDLGARSGLPVFHIDLIHWQAGWVERSKAEKDRPHRDVHRQDAWIFEGGHSRTYAERVARADTFIWLDVPVALRLWRVLRRSVIYFGRTRPDLPEGCPERINRETVAFIAYILRTRRSARARLEAIWRNPPTHLRTFRLRSVRDVRRFLEGVPEGRTAVRPPEAEGTARHTSRRPDVADGRRRP
jgi:adenylate kinase family enzyme